MDVSSDTWRNESSQGFTMPDLVVYQEECLFLIVLDLDWHILVLVSLLYHIHATLDPSQSQQFFHLWEIWWNSF